MFSTIALAADASDAEGPFSAVKRDWYAGGMHPRPSNADIARMQDAYARNPKDPQIQCWIAVLATRRWLDVNSTPVQLLTEAADRQGARAMALLGGAYLKGDGVQADKARAMALLQPALDRKESEAAIQLARAYLHGTAVLPADPETAVRYARQAADMGDNRAHYVLAQYYDRVRRDVPASLKELTAGADGGDTDCACSLADAYQKGRGVPVDAAKAMRYMQQASIAGVGSMQRELAKCLIDGFGGVQLTDQNRTTARRLLETAADNGDREAVRILALMHLEGRLGYAVDTEEAIHLLKHGIELKDPAAAYELGYMHIEGLVVPRDLDVARHLLEQAAAMGSDNARDVLARLNRATSRPATRSSADAALR